jgi:hypothetical protein
MGLATVVALLLAFSAKTWSRNWDWQDEETLFIAAQKVHLPPPPPSQARDVYHTLSYRYRVADCS